MRRTQKHRSSAGIGRSRLTRRPFVEPLEQRLPPGDALAGFFLAGLSGLAHGDLRPDVLSTSEDVYSLTLAESYLKSVGRNEGEGQVPLAWLGAVQADTAIRADRFFPGAPENGEEPVRPSQTSEPFGDPLAGELDSGAFNATVWFVATWDMQPHRRSRATIPDDNNSATVAAGEGSDGAALVAGSQRTEGSSGVAQLAVLESGESVGTDLAVMAALAYATSPGTGSSLSTDPGSPNKGVDYWLTFPGNHGVEEPELTLFITAAVNTTGTVAVPGLGFSTGFSVTAGAVTSVTLPPAAELQASNAVENKGIRVTAAAEVAVYGLNYIQHSTDSYLALPTTALGTEYIVLGYKNTTDDGLVRGYGSSQFAIVGSANGTTVTITPSVTTDGHPAGQPYNVTLQQGQTYLLRNTVPYPSPNDLSGSSISANKPVAVLAGLPCGDIPSAVPACNHIVEQLPPVQSWGASFVTMPLATRLNGDTFRFLASTDGTDVRVNNELPVTLNRGQVHERIITGPAHISATKPILLAQYSNGRTYNGVATADPSMTLVPSIDQFLDAYTVTTATPTNWFTSNYVNVVVPSAVVGQVTLDGTPIPAGSFTTIGSSGYSGAQVAVSPGTHTLAGSRPFGALVYGFAFYTGMTGTGFDAYSYPAGMLLREHEIYSNSEPPSKSPLGGCGDNQGIDSQDSGGAGTGVYVHNGEFHHCAVDLEIPGRGFNWRFERAYRSGVRFKSPLGYNWDFNYNRRLRVVTSVNLAEIQLTFPTAQVNDVPASPG